MSEDKIKEEFNQRFNKCKEIALKYQLSTDEIEKNLVEIKDFKVTTPIIGGFSTGKSSMINALVEDNILKTDITPETAIPTEISFGNNNVQLYANSQLIKTINIDEFKDNELSFDKVDLIKLESSNEFLSQIKSVKIVDMPGFDSGIELHNKAIDNYLPNSLAYIVTFSADESVIKESIVNFLEELKLHNVPVYVVITKCDKVTESNLNKTIDYMKENVPKYLNNSNVRIVCVKSKRNKDVSGLKEILLEIQGKSQDIFYEEFSIKLKSCISTIEKYINSRLININLSDSELNTKEEELQEKAESNLQKLEKEKEKFNLQIPVCIKNIQTQIESNLRGASSMLQSMILNNTDIQDKINQIVRNAVITGIKREFEPKLQKYLKNISDLISLNLDMDTSINLDEFRVAADNMVKDIVVKSIPVVLAAIGGILGGPIGAIIGGALAIFVDTFFKTKQDKEKRQMAREKVESEIIPMIIKESGSCIETEILSYVDEIDNNIQKRIEEEKEIIKKSLEDIKNKRTIEEENKEEQINILNSDLEKVRGLLNGI
ncbi:dynamin family protein [Clostridium butyricum]|uniref:dynamin family protein n=1 Tax=Clostridium butyricum TaxID=1492 RepID=UPI003D32DC75